MLLQTRNARWIIRYRMSSRVLSRIASSSSEETMTHFYLHQSINVAQSCVIMIILAGRIASLLTASILFLQAAGSGDNSFCHGPIDFRWRVFARILLVCSLVGRPAPRARESRKIMLISAAPSTNSKSKNLFRELIGGQNKLFCCLSFPPPRECENDAQR